MLGSLGVVCVVISCLAAPAASFSYAPVPIRGIHRLSPRAATFVLPRESKQILKMSTGVPLDSSQFDTGDANPIDSMEALDKVVPRAKITELIKQTSDKEGLLQVGWQVMCYSVCAAAAVIGEALHLRPLLILGVTGMAFVTSFLFMALHETVHRSAFRTRFLNDAVMHIAGFLCLRPATHYFYYHWGHHKYTGNPEKDSELQPSALDMDVSTIPGYFLYLSGLPFWFDAITTTLAHAAGRSQAHEKYLTSAKAKSDVTSEARIYTLLYASLLALSLWHAPLGAALTKFWVIPSVLGQPMLRFYLFSEHRGCKETPNIFENTRGMATNWFYRRMAWQMPYHLEHHAWPYVPFHKLPAAHALVVAAGGQASNSCDPPGNGGYIRLNLAFLRRLLPRPGESAPSGAA